MKSKRIVRAPATTVEHEASRAKEKWNASEAERMRAETQASFGLTVWLVVAGAFSATVGSPGFCCVFLTCRLGFLCGQKHPTRRFAPSDACVSCFVVTPEAIQTLLKRLRSVLVTRVSCVPKDIKKKSTIRDTRQK